MKVHIEFSLGPVQGFVAQSRRTRDLWGGSYLLSYLTTRMILAAERAEGQLVRPNLGGSELYRRLGLLTSGSAGGSRIQLPHVGSVPNHFVVEASDEKQDEVVRAVLDQFAADWKRIAESVWLEYVKRAAGSGAGTKKIWDRQTQGFWEVLWVVGERGTTGRLLARRKAWRTHALPEEPGDKCTVIHDLEELSGYCRAAGEGQQQEEFWREIRKRTSPLDLREDERLSAIALIRRLFPHVAHSCLGGEVDSQHWPSTVFMGALPWVREVVVRCPRAGRRYAQEVGQRAGRVFPQWQRSFEGLSVEEAGKLPELDPDYLHRGLLRDPRRTPLDNETAVKSQEGGEEISPARMHLISELATLYEELEKAGGPGGPPPVFYALLLADGDRLGELGRQLGSDSVGRALAAFTSDVEKVVKRYDGVTVYAGGDDVLAMLPVSAPASCEHSEGRTTTTIRHVAAIACAEELAQAYREAFRAQAQEGASATLSAAICYAHIRVPLGAVLSEVRRLLDEVAKDRNGRNSLAVGLLRRGGLHAQWARQWPDVTTGATSLTTRLETVVEALRGLSAETGVSSSLLQRIRASLDKLQVWERWVPGEIGTLPDGFDLETFVRGEVASGLRHMATEQVDATSVGEALAELLEPEGAARSAPSGRVVVDGLIVARFLSQGGYEEHEP